MDNLPVELASDIFSRLSVDIVLECRRVCKTWRDLLAIRLRLNDHHHNRNNGVLSKVSTLGLILLVGTVKLCHPFYYEEFEDYYGEFDEENNTDYNGHCIQNKLRFRTSRKYRMRSLIGSCNGLICLAEPDKSGNLQDSIRIYNPITREYLYVQGYNENNDYHNVTEIYSGFGYVLQTNEYKVVRILYDERSERGDIQVYTIGGGNGWRNKGVVITSWLYPEPGVFANGAIHWLDKKGKDIMAFNLLDETFHVLPAGPFTEGSYRFSYILGSLGKWLCVSGCDENCPLNCLDIWTLKKVSLKAESWSWWCKEFSINLDSSPSVWNYRPFAVTKTGLILLKHKASELFCYYPKTETMKRLGIWNSFEAIPHTNSLVSLEALGETTCKKRKKRSISLENLKAPEAPHAQTLFRYCPKTATWNYEFSRSNPSY